MNSVPRFTVSWNKAGQFFLREFRLIGLGLGIGLAYQIYYYSSGFRGHSYGRIRPPELFSLEALRTVTPYLIVWLIVWRTGAAIFHLVRLRAPERTLKFLAREFRLLGVGVVIGYAYQIYYYTSKDEYREIRFAEFLSLGVIPEIAAYLIQWLIVWRVGIALFRSLRIRISEIGKSVGQPQDSVFDTTESAPAVRIVVHGLRKRARLAGLAANASLVLIVISLLGGLFIFRSAESSAAAGQVEGAIRYRQYDLDSLASENRYLHEELRAIAAGETKSSGDNKNASVGDVAAIKERIDELRKQMDDGRTELRSISKDLLHPQVSMTYLWSVLSTKIGSSLLILFLVQILITLYRYSTRVAAFYEARADALQIASEVDALSLKDLVDALSADKVDFGKGPVPPSQMVFNAVKSALEKATEIGVEAAKKARA